MRPEAHSFISINARRAGPLKAVTRTNGTLIGGFSFGCRRTCFVFRGVAFISSSVVFRTSWVKKLKSDESRRRVRVLGKTKDTSVGAERSVEQLREGRPGNFPNRKLLCLDYEVRAVTCGCGSVRRLTLPSWSLYGFPLLLCASEILIQWQGRNGGASR